MANSRVKCRYKLIQVCFTVVLIQCLKDTKLVARHCSRAVGNMVLSFNESQRSYKTVRAYRIQAYSEHNQR